MTTFDFSHDIDDPMSGTTPEEDAQWWRDAVVYQIYPRSFADANGDGIGDFPGITARLDSLAELGVDCIWLSPFYVSPGRDGGYDVADYRDVDPMFGTLADFDSMLAKAHRLGLKVIVDIVPNHASSAHPWFQAALAAPPGSPERTRFHFHDGRGENGSKPPNNWPSAFFGPAWTRTTDPDGSPGQWYLHMFDSSQPDWNWDNEEVREEFRSVLRFWLDRGVDGFRVDVATSLIKEPGLPDRADLGEFDPFPGLFGLEEDGSADGANDPIHAVYRDWRKVLEEYSPARIMVAEAWLPPQQAAQFLRPDEMHQSFNFAFLEAGWKPDLVRHVVRTSLEANEKVGATTTWVLSNHDVIRHPTRLGFAPDTPRMFGMRATDPQPDAALGLRRARAFTLAMLALPGSAYLYQGEELGLPDHTTLEDAHRQDPSWMRSGGLQAGRDGCRIPLPWEAQRPALGFSPTGESWLPQPLSYADLARDRQSRVDGSTLELYRQALQLRRDRRLGSGTVVWASSAPEGVLVFHNGAVLSVTNMSNTPIELPPGDVLLSSAPVSDGWLHPDASVWLQTSA